MLDIQTMLSRSHIVQWNVDLTDCDSVLGVVSTVLDWTNEAISAAKKTAMNPAVLGSFALAIIPAGDDPKIDSIPGYEFAKDVLTAPFKIGDNQFDVIISKSKKAKSHKFLYCAHGRVVKEVGISKYIEDLRFKVNNQDAGQPFFYQVFVVGSYLDENVNGERTNFDFKSEDDEAELDSNFHSTLLK